MTNFGYITKQNIENHNPNWPQNFNHLYRILATGILISEKTNA